MAALDVAAVAAYPLKWTSAVDNVWDFGVLASLPTDLGLTATLNGTSSHIDATEAGYWSFATFVELSAADATWLGYLEDGLWSVENLARQVEGATQDQARATLAYSVGLPSGGRLSPTIQTVQVAAGALTATALMAIVRLG
jgi:hypothetical protein